MHAVSLICPPRFSTCQPGVVWDTAFFLISWNFESNTWFPHRTQSRTFPPNRIELKSTFSVCLLRSAFNDPERASSAHYVTRYCAYQACTRMTCVHGIMPSPLARAIPVYRTKQRIAQMNIMKQLMKSSKPKSYMNPGVRVLKSAPPIHSIPLGWINLLVEPSQDTVHATENVQFSPSSTKILSTNFLGVNLVPTTKYTPETSTSSRRRWRFWGGVLVFTTNIRTQKCYFPNVGGTILTSHVWGRHSWALKIREFELPPIFDSLRKEKWRRYRPKTESGTSQGSFENCKAFHGW